MTGKPSIVIYAGAAYDGVRRSARSMGEALVPYADVFFVDPSTSPVAGADGIDIRPGSTMTDEGVRHVLPVSLPAHTRGPISVVVDRLILASVRRALAEAGHDAPTATLLQVPHRPLSGRLGEQVSAYWATDHYTAGADLVGVDGGRLASAEGRAASRADVVIAVSPALAEDWERRHDSVAHVGHGVALSEDDDAPRPADLPTGRPVAGVVGTLSPRIDLDLLDAVIARGMHIALIGPLSLQTERDEFERFLARPEVFWLGEKPHRLLRQYYPHIDVGLVPYRLSEFNRFSSPLKPLEYLGAGLPVVSTRLPEVETLDLPDITIADDRDSFAAAVEAGARARYDTALVTRRRESVRDRTWDRRAQELLAALGLPVTPVG